MKLFLAACALMVPSFGAHAAELPAQFHGLWVAAEIPNKDKCRKEEPKGEDDRPVDSMMSVEGRTITYYEHQCTVQSATRCRVCQRSCNWANSNWAAWTESRS